MDTDGRHTGICHYDCALTPSVPEPHRDVFLVGAVAYVTMIAVYTWTWAALALHADQLRTDDGSNGS